MPTILEAYARLIEKTILTLVVLGLTLVIHRVAGRLLRRQVGDIAHGHTLRMLIRNSVFSLGSVAVLLIWLGVGSNFAVVMGVLGAGIAFASQEVIGSFAGYLNIITGSQFRIGDRVKLGQVVGDVLDITMLRTTVMEIGEWVNADQYTGRVVSIANRAVFSDPLFSYSQHWHCLWDEITIPVTYTSNWRRAQELMLAHAEEYSSHFLVEAEAELDRMRERYPVHPTPVKPELYLTMTDNWIEMTLRYVVSARERRGVKGQLHRELLRHFEETPDVAVASATFEIVGFPPLRGVRPDVPATGAGTSDPAGG